MQEEVELLVKAIESLKQENNPFKDYAYPLVSGFFSAVLGGTVAYFALRHQENTQFERIKLDSANEFTLALEGALQSLVAIKSNYNEKINNNPYQRASQIPSVLHSANKLSLDLTKLSFLVPKKEDTKALEIKWRSLPRIRSMIHNYNHVVELWDKRTEIDRPIKEKLVKENSETGYAYLTREEIFGCVGASDFTVLIDITEYAVKLTDDMLKEIGDFLESFPDLCKSEIKTKRIKSYGTVFTYSVKGNQALENMLIRVPEVNYEELSDLFNESVEVVRSRYDTGY